MKTSLTTLTGAVNLILEQVKLVESRLSRIENASGISELTRSIEQIEKQEREYNVANTEEVTRLQ